MDKRRQGRPSLTYEQAMNKIYTVGKKTAKTRRKTYIMGLIHVPRALVGRKVKLISMDSDTQWKKRNSSEKRIGE